MVSVGNDVFNLAKYDKLQITDTTINKTGNSGGCLLPLWKIVCNHRNNSGKLTNFIRVTESRSPTPNSGATSLPPIGDTFMYMKTSQNNYAQNFFVVLREQVLFR